MGAGGVADRVREAHERGRAEHPAFALPLDGFARLAGAAAAAGPRHPGDLYLAAACAAGIEAAWEALRRDLLPGVRALLVRRGVPSAEAEAVVAELPGHLVAPGRDGDGAPRIAGFRGESRLATWLSVVAWRRANERRDGGRRLVALDAAGGAVDGRATPLTAALGAELAARFEAALHAAWGALTPRECLALLLRYRDGLPQGEIARMLGVGEPRVSRLLAAGLRRLREEVHRVLGETPAPGVAGEPWEALREAVRRRLATPDGTAL
jgi:RNA polymerase sigma factor (sigma-70 family)